MTLSPTAPVVDLDLATLEAAFALPAHEPRHRTSDAASVPDSPRAPLDAMERIALGMLVLAVGGLVALVLVSIVA